MAWYNLMSDVSNLRICLVAINEGKGQVKANEVNVLQNGLKTTHKTLGVVGGSQHNKNGLSR